MLGRIAVTVLNVELATTVALTARYRLGYDKPFGTAVWVGLFHGVSAFNNAGFALSSDTMISHVTDPWICLPIAVAVLFELYREARRPRRWTIHTKITVLGSAALVAGSSSSRSIVVLLICCAYLSCEPKTIAA